MAYHLIQLEDLTVAQLQILAEQRNRNGFHAHYTGGFDASKKLFGLACPGYMSSGCVLTTAFRYPGPSGLQGQVNDSYPISLGMYKDYKNTYVKVFFAGKDELKVERRYKGNKSLLTTRRARNVEGFHVLEFQRERLNLKVYLDGELLIPARTITGGADIDAHVVLLSDDKLIYAPFVFYESHYTMDHVGSVINVPAFYNPQKDYFFPHESVEITVGGYVLWYGAWRPGQDVAAQNYNGVRLAGTVRNPQVGDLTLLLKFYKDGCTLSDANDTTKVPSVMPSFKSINLKELYVKPDPASFFEFKAVTGQIKY